MSYRTLWVKIDERLLNEDDLAMRMTPEGIALIKRFEGLRLTAYRCPAGVLTIGWGSTCPPISEGMVITEEEAEDRLWQKCAELEQQLLDAIHVPLSDNQLSALISFCYNIGFGAFRSSTLFRYLNAGCLVDASNEFQRWDKADGKVLTGLLERRRDEQQLFGTPDRLIA